MVVISGMAGLWSAFRLLLLQTDIGSSRHAPFDIPLFFLSPVALAWNLVFTLTLITLIGVITGVIALFRQKERWRFWAIITIPLNIIAWVIAFRFFEWAFNPPLGVDF